MYAPFSCAEEGLLQHLQSLSLFSRLRTKPDICPFVFAGGFCFAFGFLAFWLCGFWWLFGFGFRILCFPSSSVAGGFLALAAFRWLCGFGVFFGFGLSHPMLSQFLSGRWLFDFPHPEHHEFLPGKCLYFCVCPCMCITV